MARPSALFACAFAAAAASACAVAHHDDPVDAWRGGDAEAEQVPPVVDAARLDAALGPVDASADPGCAVTSLYDAYAAPGVHPVGPVGQLPWRGPLSSYPAGDEDFSGYGPAYPVQVECSDDKDQRGYLDVTEGCLSAAKSGSRTVGRIQAAADDAFRVVALGFGVDPTLDVRWTDMSTGYAFHYTQGVGSANNPGFKVFVRYQTEDDLYVGSWRTDGVVQIQRKQCGVYTPLAILHAFGAPTANAWHTIQMTAVGSMLTLSLDGVVAVSVEDATFPSGTAGIRIDGMDGALIDDWKVAAP